VTCDYFLIVYDMLCCVLQVKFYRHLRFFHDNTVLYSLDNLPPDDAMKLLSSGSPVPKRVRVILSPYWPNLSYFILI